jgi:hypothetical protein
MQMTDIETAKPDVSAMQRAAMTPLPQVVAKVAEALGDRLTAVIADVKTTRTLRAWIQNGDVPIEAGKRLQGALAAIALLSAEFRPDEVSAWFSAMNDELGDASPAMVLRGAQTIEEGELRSRAVISAAKAHLVG